MVDTGPGGDDKERRVCKAIWLSLRNEGEEGVVAKVVMSDPVRKARSFKALLRKHTDEGRHRCSLLG